VNYTDGWRKKLDVVLRQNHRAGEKLFVDYAAGSVAIRDRASGEVRQASFWPCRARFQLHLCGGHLDAIAADWIIAHIQALSSSVA
jgi:transposase